MGENIDSLLLFLLQFYKNGVIYQSENFAFAVISSIKIWFSKVLSNIFLLCVKYK